MRAARLRTNSRPAGLYAELAVQALRNTLELRSQTEATVVLIVDDHADTAALLARLLQLHGHNAIAVASAKDALTVLERVRPDVIVLDVMMPEMDGPALLKALRENASFRSTPVVMYSADFSHERLQETQRLGAQDFIVKGTIGFEDLCSRIGKYDHSPATH